ncbi:amidohydrolase family protein [Chitinophaga pinensis]|uniref:Amidohydrolase 2 n=1 Tax=Chitinophaga pinensis (strain ATCC 43595 / DSM 2588 / LMG 13176 / NBRC 15968 / NCIMB 11800 / UQM 2034) TaxID=485918 RepID=A0A979G6I1_CHIPD|nr:amidohydrolase family protein [Chitinophaga pinensis]ACU61779.1 amidohydrolase 2 [Chitinophaga pinensis DSM 2588]
MRIVTLEEHVSFPEMTALLPEEILKNRKQSGAALQMQEKLADITGERLTSMKAAGISMQVLSVENTDVYLLPDSLAPAFAAKYNDLLADKISSHSDAFAAFAMLPMTVPEAAADELERAVKTHGFCGAMIKGLINGVFLDAPKFAPVFACAEKLGVPLYIHPGIPPKEVIDAYYSNVGDTKGPNEAIACYGWGWHSETAIHILRLLAAGIFDKYPQLNIIIGHMGEMLPMMWERSNRVFQPGNNGKNQRTLIETFRKQLYITTSGIFTQPPLQIAIDTIGIDNILFSIDYPFSSNQMGIDFLTKAALPAEQLAKMAHGNADRILKF